MKVCLVSYEFPPAIGGEGTYTYTLFQALSKFGVDVKVITSDINQRTEGLLGVSADICYVRTINKPSLKLLSFCSVARSKLKELCRKSKIDVIHYTNDYCGFFLPKPMVSKPLVATMHFTYAIEHKIMLDQIGWDIPTYINYRMTRRPLLADKLQNTLSRRADGIISVSKFVAETVSARHGVPSQKIKVIPNAVDIQKFDQKIEGTEIRDRWSLSSEPVVLYVGRWVHYKGLTYLAHAFKEVVREISDAQLILVGEGILRRTLIDMSRKLGISDSVKFIGRVSAEELPKTYAAADVIVYPSLTEGFGLVLLEAMAMAKPCIATLAGAFPEVVVDGETGFLVRPADWRSLCKAMCVVLTDKSLAKKLGEAGRRRVELVFTPEVMARKTLTLYEQILTQCRKAI